MLTRILLILTLALSSVNLFAQGSKSAKSNSRTRSEWFSEMSKYKAQFIASELKLSDEQKQKFIDAYSRMENESANAARDARKMEKEVRDKGEKATDLELEKAAEASSELKLKQAQIEQKYFKQFKSILSPRQLFNLGNAERKFTRQIMNHRKSRPARD